VERLSEPAESNALATLDSVCAQLLAPSEFKAHVVPVSASGMCQPTLFAVPESYAAALRDQERAAQELHASMHAAGLTHPQMQHMQSLVHQAFRDWLSETGQLKHIVDLVATERAALAPQQLPAAPRSPSAAAAAAGAVAMAAQSSSAGK
jgi:hypothetical protein